MSVAAIISPASRRKVWHWPALTRLLLAASRCSANILAPSLVDVSLIGRTSAILALLFQVSVRGGGLICCHGQLVLLLCPPMHPFLPCCFMPLVLLLSTALPSGQRLLKGISSRDTHMAVPPPQVAHFAGLLLAVALAIVLYGDVVG